MRCLLGLLLAATVLLAACGGDDEEDPTPTMVEAAQATSSDAEREEPAELTNTPPPTVADASVPPSTLIVTSGPTPDLEAGRQIVETICASCHLVEGTTARGNVGPELTRFANNSQIAGVVDNNEENLRAWLFKPQDVKKGTPMPQLGLNQEQIDALVVYLYTLDGSAGS